MTLSDFRAEYPEYADLPDSEVMNLIEPPETEDEEPFEAPGIESELSSIALQLTKIVTHISKKEKDKEKPEKENTALLALGIQLSNIESAIKGVAIPEFPSIEFPVQQRIVSLTIKRDEFNHITKLIPEYGV